MTGPGIFALVWSVIAVGIGHSIFGKKRDPNASIPPGLLIFYRVGGVVFVVGGACVFISALMGALR
jgi:hypothetical protein